MDGASATLTFPPGPLPLPRCGRGPHLPPAPFRSHAAGEEGGEMSGAGAILRLATIPRLRTRSPLSRRAGEGPGVRPALTFPPGPLPLPRCGRGPHLPPAPFRSHAAGEEGGEMSGAGAILRLATIPRLRPRSPLSRRAGEGPGVRAALTFPPGPLPLPRCGRGPHLPPAPFRSHQAGAEGGVGAEQGRSCGWQRYRVCAPDPPSPAGRERGRG